MKIVGGFIRVRQLVDATFHCDQRKYSRERCRRLATYGLWWREETSVFRGGAAQVVTHSGYYCNEHTWETADALVKGMTT